MANLPGIVGAVVLGLGMSQFPEFTQQYQQRLGGAVDELRAMAEAFDETAATAGLSRAAALQQYTGTGFLDQRRQDMEHSFARLTRLSGDLEALENSTSLERLQNFTRYTDSQIAARAWEAYKPALPLTSEGLTFAAIGGAAGFVGFAGLFGLLSFRKRIFA